MTEKTKINFEITGVIGSAQIKVVKWLKGNRHQLLAIYNSFKPEIIAFLGAGDEDVNKAKLEALAHHECCANILRAQLYGHFPCSSPNSFSQREIAPPASAIEQPLATPSTPQTSDDKPILDTLDILENL